MKGCWDRERDPLAALNRGQPGLFEDFVRAEASTLIGFFERLGAPTAEAEDLTQEVFLKLYRHADHYQPQGTFEAFALRIARNAWIDRRRRDSARVPARPFSTLEADAQAVAERIPAGPGPDERLSRAEDRGRIARALATLSPKHALIFELAVVQGRPYPEIAAEQGIPVGTVKSRVFHALRRMRAALEPTAPPPARGSAPEVPRNRPLQEPLGGQP